MIIHPLLMALYPTCICSYLDIVYVLVSKELKKVASVTLTHGKPMKVMQCTLKKYVIKYSQQLIKTFVSFS